MLCVANRAWAYRPFDGTDADVAALREMELEVGPAEVTLSERRNTWVVPAIIVNYGFAPNFELVLEGRHRLAPPDRSPEQRSQITDSAISVKHVLREGCLQEHAGVSIANEWSLLLPDTGSSQPPGAEITTIFSARSQALTLHLNVYNELSRQHRYVASVGPIVEGPFTWLFRPVIEIIVAREFGSARFVRGLYGSALLGGIGRVSDDLSVDLAARYARADGTREETVRAGFTWAFDARL